MIRSAQMVAIVVVSVFYLGMASVQAGAKTPILVVGDSHTVGPFGRELDALLRADSTYSVATVGACGSSPDWFFRGVVVRCGYYERATSGRVVADVGGVPYFTPYLETLLKRYPAKGVVVEQGGNLLGMYVPNGENRAMTEGILRFVDSILKANASCLWVTPPRMPYFTYARQQSFEQYLKKILQSRCTVFSSLDQTRYLCNGGDRIHYNCSEAARQEAQAWAKKVYDQVRGWLY